MGEPTCDLPGLTPRESAVACGVVFGYSNKQIAATMGIAEHTVKVHLYHVFGKLHVHRRMDLLIRFGAHFRCPAVNRRVRLS